MGKKAQPKKAAKPKAAKKKKPARARHPLDAMEKSATFSMDKWKKTYSNSKVDWMTSNKITGYTQRLDEVRKWVFGVMGVIDRFEKKGFWDVEGFFITRGDDIKYIMDATEESGTFNWAKCCGKDMPMSDADKKEMSDMLCTMKLSAEGVDINDSIIFK